jgi:hypothetical protein
MNIIEINRKLDNFKIKIDKLLIENINTNFNQFYKDIINEHSNPFYNLNELINIYINIYNSYLINSEKNIKTNYKIRDIFFDFTILICAYLFYDNIIYNYNLYCNETNTPIRNIDEFNKYVNNELPKILNESISPEEIDLIKNLNYDNIINFYNQHIFGISTIKLIIKQKIDHISIKKYNNKTPISNPIIFTSSDFIPDNIIPIINDILIRSQTLANDNLINFNDNFVTIPQYQGICWFISIINGMCYSDLSRKLIYSKINDNISNIIKSDDIFNILIDFDNINNLEKQFITFIYIIIENISNDFKKYSDFQEEQEEIEKLFKILKIFKYFPIKFLNSMCYKIQQKPLLNSKRKTPNDEKLTISDALNKIDINNNKLIFNQNEIKKIMDKMNDKSFDEYPINIQTKLIKFHNNIYEINDENKQLLELYNKILINAIHDEKYYWLYANINNNNYGANILSYNIISNFYDYLGIKPLYLYLNNHDNNFYLPKLNSSLNRIQDYEIIIISRFNLNDIIHKEFNIDISDIFDIINDKFEDFNEFIINFKKTSNIIINKDLKIGEYNFKLDYILHSADNLESCFNCGHCISEITYNNKLYIHNSMYDVNTLDINTLGNYEQVETDEIENERNIITIPCNFIEFDWKTKAMEQSNYYRINKCYENYVNIDDIMHQMTKHTDTFAYIYNYQKDLRYIYFKI